MRVRRDLLLGPVIIVVLTLALRRRRAPEERPHVLVGLAPLRRLRRFVDLADVDALGPEVRDGAVMEHELGEARAVLPYADARAAGELGASRSREDGVAGARDALALGEFRRVLV